MNKLMMCTLLCLCACGSKTGLYDICGGSIMKPGAECGGLSQPPPDVPTCPDGTPLANDWNCDGIPNGQGGTGGSTGGTSGTGGTPSVGGTSGSGGSPSGGTGGSSTGGTSGTGGTGGTGGLPPTDVCPETSPAWERGDGWAPCITQPISQIAPSHVIKGSGAAFYWYAANGKRYLFPNVKTYRTWYPIGDDCPVVRLVEDADLAATTIVRNLTFKPGVNMLKITSDPKIYGVSQGGVLHWITNESVAVELYGWNWTQYVIDTPDAFFVNYMAGASVYSLMDFNPVDEIYGTSTIDQDLGL